jgi:hypothetical protein
MAMNKYLVERDLPDASNLNDEQLKAMAEKWNQAVKAFAPNMIEWLESNTAAGKCFCMFLADGEATIHMHAGIIGIPATKITKVKKTIGPKTG